MKAIQTNYKGYRFRSRAEARWALFFDHLGWKWEYEHEGYDLGDGVWYLPDFYFPELKLYAEVKADNFNSGDLKKPLKMSNSCNVLFLPGNPDYRSYPLLESEEHEDLNKCSDVVMVPHGSKYYPLFYVTEFDQDFFNDVVLAVNAAKSERF